MGDKIETIKDTVNQSISFVRVDLQEIIKLQEDNQLLRSQNNELNKKLSDIMFANNQKYNADISSLRSASDIINLENKELRDDVKNLTAENKELRDDVKKLTAENKELKDKNKILQAKIKQLEDTVLELKDTVLKLEATVGRMEQKEYERDCIMQMNELCVLFEDIIVDEVYGEKMSGEVKIGQLNREQTKGRLTDAQSDRWNKIREDLNKNHFRQHVGSLKKMRGVVCHKQYRSSDLTIDEATDFMIACVEQNEKDKRQQKYKKDVVEYIIDKIRNVKGDYPFEDDSEVKY
ncbi:MAG: hypothetical protein Faunusvirus16_9 [Faunusvirus sp.]|jgi:hypothetical protein|uniref:Uncharacterized protein n=1 Tax=Faunusvirus sp. TaxID=2487766 RepID=A0A3G4ZX56_9VIRU|nr:MAG: hypothetical protein Faunusvirus16_9 [Faunusvirus sp.]